MVAVGALALVGPVLAGPVLAGPAPRAAICAPGVDAPACRVASEARSSGVRLRREPEQLTILQADRPALDVAFAKDAPNDGADRDILGALFPDAVADRHGFTGKLADVANQTIDFAFATAPSVSGTIAAVPEPAGWATMILGVGLLGGVLRRRIRLSEARFAEKLRRIEAGETL